jgi:alpha-ribazole phosphatase
MTETIIDLIRHGEPLGGRAFRGHNIDDALSEKGWEQMWHAIGDDCPWDHIITSPLSRCHSFARALAEDIGINVTTIDDLKEVGFGSWEGRTPDQIKADNLKEYEDFYKDPVNNRPPGAEILDQFIQRTTSAFESVCNEYEGEHVLIVAHAGVIRSIVAHTIHATPLGMYKIKIANAGISRIRIIDGKVTLEFINGQL